LVRCTDKVQGNVSGYRMTLFLFDRLRISLNINSKFKYQV